MGVAVGVSTGNGCGYMQANEKNHRNIVIRKRPEQKSPVLTEASLFSGQLCRSFVRYNILIRYTITAVYRPLYTSYIIE